MKNKKTPKKIMKSVYIKGWKELADYLGYHPRTLLRWHHEIAHLPFMKTHPKSSRSRWVTTVDRVHIWLKNIGKD